MTRQELASAVHRIRKEEVSSYATQEQSIQKNIENYERGRARSCGVKMIRALAEALRVHWTQLQPDQARCRLRLEAGNACPECEHGHVPNSQPLSPEHQQAEEQGTDRLTTVERLAGADLFTYPGGRVRALQFFGVQDQMWSEEEVQLKYNPEPLQHVESGLTTTMRRRVEQAQRDPKFFDGPNARLVSFDAPWPRAPEDTGPERKTVGFELGPVSWGEYIGLNRWAKERLPNDAPSSELDFYLGKSLFNDHKLDECLFSNICCTATTLVTSDGYLAYALRKDVGPDPSHYTSAVAENINRYLDDADLKDPRVLANPWIPPKERRAASIRAGRDYRCRFGPHPFATVRRGIEEELSPSLLNYLEPCAVKLTGLVFDFNDYDPAMLFVACINLTRQEFVRWCNDDRGIDYREKELHFVSPDFTNPDTKAALSFEKWIPSGKASLLRAIQIVTGLKRRTRKWEVIFDCMKGPQRPEP
jgi:hypothetical protein